jgi:hypothetical protein
MTVGTASDLERAVHGRAYCEAIAAARALQLRLDNVYAERNVLAIALATLFGGRWERASDAVPGWSNCIIFDLPSGQVSFHIPDSLAVEANRFPLIGGTGDKWDGHDDFTKWQRIVEFCRRSVVMP